MHSRDNRISLTTVGTKSSFEHRNEFVVTMVKCTTKGTAMSFTTSRELSWIIIVAVAGVLVPGGTAYGQPVEDLGGDASASTLEEIGGESPDGEVVPAPTHETRTRTFPTTIGGASAQIIGYYSPSLRGFFAVRWFRRGPFVFPGAKLLGEVDFDSPLNRLGLRSGDIITRLDDRRVRDYDELERHYADTSVRYIRQSTGNVRVGMIYIDAGGLTP